MTDSPDTSRRARRHAGTARKRLLLPLILIAVGAVALLVRSGLIDPDLLRQWWPAVLVLAGVLLLALRLARRTGAP